MKSAAKSRRQVRLMNGATANRRGRSCGVFDYAVSIVAGRTKILPFTIWMPRLDTQHATPIPVPTTRDLVLTTPRVPGLGRTSRPGGPAHGVRPAAVDGRRPTPRFTEVRASLVSASRSIRRLPSLLRWKVTSTPHRPSWVTGPKEDL